MKRKRKTVEVKKVVNKPEPKMSKIIQPQEPIDLYTCMIFGNQLHVAVQVVTKAVEEYQQQLDETGYSFSIMQVPEEKVDIIGRFRVKMFPTVVLQKDGEVIQHIPARQPIYNVIKNMEEGHQKALNIYIK